MAYYVIVHQPSCSNVIEVDGKYGGQTKRLYQGGRERCAGYLQAVLDAGGERYCGLNSTYRDVICGPGNCLTQHWVERDAPSTWHSDCREWR